MSDTTDVRAHGAAGDGRHLDTAALQRAIDACAAAGGGRVWVGPGRYRTGTLHLRSWVTLELAAQAVLVASEDPADLVAIGPRDADGVGSRHLLSVHGCERVRLCGGGTIDGSAPAYCLPATDPEAWIQPAPTRYDAMLSVSESRDVVVEGLRLTNAPNWNMDIHLSDRVRVHGLNIVSDARSPNNDGIDVSGSRDVIISDCHIDTGDDGIVLNGRGRSCERIQVSNCRIRSECAALKVGWEYTRHAVRSVAFSNCIITGCSRGFAAYSCNGAIIEDITVSNLVIDTCCPVLFPRPIHLDLRRPRDGGDLGAMRRIRISNVLARSNGRVLITGDAGCPVEDVRIRDLALAWPCVEDPEPLAEANTSHQFSNPHRAARRARAGIVLEQVRDLHIDGVTMAWPTAPVPAEWRFARKRENGSLRVTEHRYDTPCPVSFHAVWARKAQGRISGDLRSSQAGHALADLGDSALDLRPG